MLPCLLSTALAAEYGINVHFVSNSRPGEIQQLTKVARVARNDLLWEAVERSPGSYNFAPYDVFTQRMVHAGIRPYLILDCECTMISEEDI
jgi:hypothetical protein